MACRRCRLFRRSSTQAARNGSSPPPIRRPCSWSVATTTGPTSRKAWPASNNLKCPPNCTSMPVRATALVQSLSQNYKGCCGEGFWSWPRRRGGASPKRAVTTEPTLAKAKRPAARRVFAQQAVWLRCSSVEDPQKGYSPSSRLAIQPSARKQHRLEFSDRLLRANDPKPAGKWIERFEEWLADSGFLKKS